MVSGIYQAFETLTFCYAVDELLEMTTSKQLNTTTPGKPGLRPGPLTIPKGPTQAGLCPVKTPYIKTPFSSDERVPDGPVSSLSPVSSQGCKTTSTSTSTGARLARFFPELANNAGLVSPLHQCQHPFVGLSQGHSRNVSSHTQARSSSSDAGASSCYSRRSSLTSMGSEYPGCAYKSADAYSIESPVAAGVFDESLEKSGGKDMEMPRKHAWKKRVVKQPSMAEVKNKPLPREPPIEMAPLAVRDSDSNKNLADLNTLASVQGEGENASATGIGDSAEQGLAHGPTLSQAEEDLENALVEYCTSNHYHSDYHNAIQDAGIHALPLQISRGAMQMVASRPAPRPPSNILPHSLQQQRQQEADKKSARSKMPFRLSVPGIGRKLHLRSASSSNMRSEMESDSHGDRGTTTAAENKEAKPRPSSISSERELRLRLPRLQTKKIDPVGRDQNALAAAIAAVTATATATATTPSSFAGRTPDSIAGGPMKPIEYGVVEEKVFVSSSKMRQGQSYVSLQPEVVYELDAGIQSPTIKVTETSPSSAVSWPSILPVRVVRSILEQAESLDDLFSMAVLNRQFYRILKLNELALIKNAVFRMSPPAWELREMSPPWDSEWQGLLDPDAQVPDYTPTLYLQRYAQDLFILAQIKSLVLARCCSFLRPDTIRGLSGVDFDRATEVDDALWRVWTFCRIFGCGKGRENDIAGQTDWLNGGVQARNQHDSMTFSITEPFGMNNVLFEPPAGFGMGNPDGLSQGQMYDMTELFTCLHVLLQPIHGKCREARRAGIYNGFDLKVGDDDKEEKTLEEWTYYILTLGLSAVLSLGSICPIKNATTTFQKAQTMGLTKWDLSDAGVTRSSFLKEAVSKSYKAREDASSVGSSSNASGSSSRASLNDQSSQSTTTSSDKPIQHHRVRQVAFAAELRNQRAQPRNVAYTSFADERPISSYTVVMNGLDGLSRRHQQERPPLSPPHAPIPPVYAPSLSPSHGPGPVLDPVDRAIDLIVRELGFNENDAKWALKITDTGEGINTDAAVSLLIRESQARNAERGWLFSSSSRAKEGTLMESIINEDGMGWRWA